jgi:hypothetical protein
MPMTWSFLFKKSFPKKKILGDCSPKKIMESGFDTLLFFIPVVFHCWQEDCKVTALPW